MSTGTCLAGLHSLCRIGGATCDCDCHRASVGVCRGCGATVQPPRRFYCTEGCRKRAKGLWKARS